jgi:hypothetical protein
MSDEIDLGKLSDRELLVLCVQGLNSHAKRLDSHASKIRSLELFRNWAAGAATVIAGIVSASKLNIKLGQGS